MQMISIRKISITDLDTEIIVNAANSHLQHGGGVCGYIFNAAGPKQLQDACNKIGYCPTGSAVITPGFNLCKYIIHAVGPVWHGGNQHEPQQLYNCYTASLDLALKNNCHTIGFPLISAGIFGYPKDHAWKKAIQSINDWFINHKDYYMEVVFAALNDEIISLGRKTVRDIAPTYYQIAKADFKSYDMPKQHDNFILDRVFTKEQMGALKKGNLPRAMEDKWFLYMDGNRFYAHRSWSGFCIYIIEFQKSNHHNVTVNRDPEQYKCTSIEEDITNLNKLLDWWTESPYDHYNEWLSETYDSLKKAGKV